MSDKIHEPLEPPTIPCPTDPRAGLTDVERVMYDGVLDHFSRDGYTIPGLENGALTEVERFFVSYECILRWVGARLERYSQAQHAVLP